MDIVSHGLWTYVAARTARARKFPVRPLVASAFGMAPDVIAFAPLTLWSATQLVSGNVHLAGHKAAETYIAENVPWLETLTTTLYSATHSLIVWSVLLAGCVLIRHGWRESLAWLVHILIDIPTHTQASYPTPALWPICPWTFDGVSWRTPAIFVPNVVFLTLAIFALRLTSRRKSVVAPNAGPTPDG